MPAGFCRFFFDWFFLPCYNDFMSVKAKQIDLGKDKIGRLIVRLAVPAVVAQIINLLYNLVDRMYVSGIRDVGTEALAGLGVVFPITLIVSAFANLVGLGGAPLASIFLGEKKRGEAEKVFNAGFVLLILFGIVLTAAVLIFCAPLVRAFGAPSSSFSYGRDYLFVYGIGTLFVMFSLGLNPFITAQGFSFTSMCTVLIGAVLNIGLDPIFIYVLDMGVKGAALATILSQAVSAVWAVCFFFRKNTAYRIRPQMFLPRLKTVGRILFLGLSPFIMSVTESAIQIVFNNTLTYWSGENSDYTAALTIMLSAIQMVCLPLNGLGSGVQPLVSYNYGRGGFRTCPRYGKICDDRGALRKYGGLAALFACAAGLRIHIQRIAVRHANNKKVYAVFYGGYGHVFCADDTAKRFYSAQSGKDIYISCLSAKSYTAYTAVFSSSVCVRCGGCFLQRGDCGRRRRHRHCGHFLCHAAAHT